MPTCELCGAEEKLTRAKVSGAELRVCSDCADLGTTLGDESESNSTTSKYSTSSGGRNTDSSGGSGDSKKSKNSTNNSNSSNQSRRNDYDDISELAFDYGEIIEEERKSRGMNRAELAQELGIKKSHLRNIEKEKTQPDMALQKKIESYLDVDLTMGDIDY